LSRSWLWSLDVILCRSRSQINPYMTALGRQEFSLGSVAVEQTVGAISYFLKNSAIQSLACYAENECP